MDQISITIAVVTILVGAVPAFESTIKLIDKWKNRKKQSGLQQVDLSNQSHAERANIAHANDRIGESSLSAASKNIALNAYVYPVGINNKNNIFFGDSTNKVYRQHGNNTDVLYSHSESVTAIALTSTILISGGRDGKLIAYDYLKNAIIDEESCGCWIYGLSFISDHAFACGNNDGYVSVYEVVENKLHLKYKKQLHSSRIHDLLFFNDSCIVTCGKDKKMIFFDINKETTFNYELPETPYCLACNGNMLAIGTDEGCVILFNMNERKIECKFRLHSKRINGICFLDREKLVTGSRDHSISVFNIISKKHTITIKLDGEINRIIANGNNEIYAGTDGNYLYYHIFSASSF